MRGGRFNGWYRTVGQWFSPCGMYMAENHGTSWVVFRRRWACGAWVSGTSEKYIRHAKTFKEIRDNPEGTAAG